MTDCVCQPSYYGFIGTGVSVLLFIASEVLGTRADKQNKCTSILQLLVSGSLKVAYSIGWYKPDTEPDIEKSNLENIPELKNNELTSHQLNENSRNFIAKIPYTKPSWRNQTNT